ncbi:amidohydrolase family protein [Haloarculaceae archaeon H-GB11]|nr:amidohydrolase family protein [Haloarculaceae archaeon H-GB11]
MSTTPARTFGMPQKGTLEPGTDADVVIFDPDAPHRISAADGASHADFSIYDGLPVSGRVEKTFVRGELVADDGEIVCDDGHGQFLEREIPDWSG